MARILKLLAFLVVLVIVGAGALFVLLPTKQIVELAADQVRAATGRDLVVTGDVTPSLYPVLGVEASGVSLSNAEWASRETMVSAENAKIGVELMPLLSGAIRVTEVRLTGADVALEVDETGRGNWVFGDDAAAPAEAGGGDPLDREIAFGAVTIEDSRVSYVDRAGGLDVTLEDIDAEIGLPALDETLTVVGGAVWNGERAEIDLALTSPAAAIAGASIDLTLSLTSAPGSLSWNGVIAPPAPGALPSVRGTWSVASPDPSAAAAWALGEAPAELAGLTAVELGGDIALDEANLDVSIAGGLSRDGRPATLDVKASGEEGWLESRAFDLSAEIGVEGLLSLAYAGAVAAPEGGAPVVDGRLDLSAPDPSGLMAFATGAADPALAGLSDVAIKGPVSMTGAGLAVDLTGGATRDGRRAEVALKAASGADWADSRAFELSLNAASDGLFSLAFVGAAAAPEGALPRIDGRLDASVADASALSAWATGAADPALAGLTNIAVAGPVAVSDSGLNVNVTGGATREGLRVNAALKAAAGAGWMTSRAFDVALDASADGVGKLVYAGAVAAPEGGAPRADGRFEIDAPDLPRLAALAGAALPAGGQGAYRRLSAAGTVSTPSTGTAALNFSALNFDDIQAQGAVTVAYQGRQRIEANLTAGALNLDPYLVDGGEAGPAGPGWSKERIDLSALGALDADIAIRAASVKAREVKLGKSDISARLSGGRLDLTIRELGLYGGGVTGDIKVDGAKNNAVAARISASAVRLRPLLNAFAGVDMIKGLGQLQIDVTGGGASLHDIMNSLGGNGSLKLTDGAVVGYNLAAMVRNVQSAFTGGGGSQDTDFSEISGTFRIAEGRLRNADFQFLGPLIRIIGEGTVDIGGQSMNFRMTPKAVTSLKGQGGDLDAAGLSFPLIIKGPWSSLSILPDLEAGIADLLSDPEGALEAVEDLVGKATEGGAAGALGAAAAGAVGAITGGDAGAGAAAGKILDAAKGGDPASALKEVLAPSDAVTQKDIDRAKKRLDRARAGGDKAKIRKARQELKALREARKAQKSQGGGDAKALQQAVGGVLKALGD